MLRGQEICKHEFVFEAAIEHEAVVECIHNGSTEYQGGWHIGKLSPEIGFEVKNPKF